MGCVFEFIWDFILGFGTFLFLLSLSWIVSGLLMLCLFVAGTGEDVVIWLMRLSDV